MRISDWSSDVCSSDLGYEVEFKILNAADYGVGTKRKRLFVVARRDGLPIRFPKPQYGTRKSPEVLAGKLLPYSPIADFIDFSIQCNPIFRSEEHTSELQSLMRTSYAVFCLKKQKI